MFALRLLQHPCELQPYGCHRAGVIARLSTQGQHGAITAEHAPEGFS